MRLIERTVSNSGPAHHYFKYDMGDGRIGEVGYYAPMKGWTDVEPMAYVSVTKDGVSLFHQSDIQSRSPEFRLYEWYSENRPGIEPNRVIFFDGISVEQVKECFPEAFTLGEQVALEETDERDIYRVDGILKEKGLSARTWYAENGEIEKEIIQTEPLRDYGENLYADYDEQEEHEYVMNYAGK